jgi:hypothetical protein
MGGAAQQKIIIAQTGSAAGAIAAQAGAVKYLRDITLHGRQYGIDGCKNNHKSGL